MAGSRGPNLLFESISGNDSLDPNVLTSEISGPVHTIGTPSQELFSKLIVKGGSDVIYYPMRGTTTGQVTSFAEDGGLIYMAGRFNQVDEVVTNNIVSWDGTTFRTLGTGINGQINSIVFSGGRLYVGGSFTTAGGISAQNLAVWNPSTQTWSAFTTRPPATAVQTICVANGFLYAGGDFVQISGPTADAVRFCRYNLSDGTVSYTAPVGTFDAIVNTIISDGSGGVYVGGNFTQTPTSLTTAGPTTNIRLTRLTSSGTFGSVNSASPNATVLCLRLYGIDLYVSGNFTTLGGQDVQRIGRIDTVANTFNSLGNPQIFGQVTSFDVNQQGIVHAAGPLNANGQFNLYRSSYLNPLNNKWQSISGGSSGSLLAAFCDSNNRVWFGGGQTRFNGVPSGCVQYTLIENATQVNVDLVQAATPWKGFIMFNRGQRVQLVYDGTHWKGYGVDISLLFN